MQPVHAAVFYDLSPSTGMAGLSLRLVHLSSFGGSSCGKGVWQMWIISEQVHGRKITLI